MHKSFVSYWELISQVYKVPISIGTMALGEKGFQSSPASFSWPEISSGVVFAHWELHVY